MANGQENFFITVLKGVFISLIATLIGVLLFSIVVKVATLSTPIIKVVNQFIKILSVFIGCFWSVRGGLGYLKGIAVGGGTTLFTYLLFALIGGAAVFGASFFVDLLFCMTIGAVSGIVAVNVKKS